MTMPMMRRRKTVLTAGIAFLFTMISLFSCRLENYLSSSAEQASIDIQLHSSLRGEARTIHPDIDLEIATYDISGTGPGSAVFSRSDVAGDTLTAENLAIGEWVFSAIAKNVAGTVIGEGSKTVLLVSGENVKAIITILPVVGSGTINLTVRWPEGALNGASIVANIERPPSGPIESVSFSAGSDGHSFVWTDAAAASGYHYFFMSIFRGAEELVGAAESIRVVNGAVSEHVFEYSSEELTPVIQKPVLSLAAGKYDSAQTLTITCTTPGATIKYTNNGSMPSDINGIEYHDSIIISSSQVLRTVAFLNGRPNSAVVSAKYEIAGTIALPSLSHRPGIWYDPIEVFFDCATTDAVIRYTMDGSDPDNDPVNPKGIVYTGEYIPVTVAAEIKAIAISADGTKFSDIVSSSYRITGHVAPVVYDLASGVYGEDRILKLSCATSGAEIRYTVNGDEPSSHSGDIYTGPIAIDRSMTVKAMAWKADWDNAPQIHPDYTMKVPTPVPSILPGVYSSDFNLELKCSLLSAKIWHTTGPAVPEGTVWTLYDQVISVTRSVTVNAKATRGGWQDSEIGTYAYTMKCLLPTFSVPPGAYIDGSLTVAMTTSTGAAIVSTTDGSDPAPDTGSLNAEWTLTTSALIKAIAKKDGWESSDVSIGDYILGDDGLSITDGSSIIDTTPFLDWNDSAVARYYRIQIASTYNFAAPVVDETIIESGYQSGVILNNKTDYWWRVRTQKADDTWQAWYGPWKFNVTLPVPQLIAPGNDESVTVPPPLLKWDASEGAIAYRLQVSAISDFTATVFDSSSLTGLYAKLTENIANNSTYHWRVAAQNVDGVWSAFSPAPFFKMAVVPIPIELTIVDNTNTSPTVVISGVPAFVYDGQTIVVTAAVQPAPDAYAWYLDGDLVAGAVGSSLSVVAANLRLGNHTIVCKATVKSVIGSASIRFEKTDNPQPSVLVSPADGLFAVGTTPTLDWTDCADADRYWVQIASDPDFVSVVIQDDTLLPSSFTLVSPLGVGRYYWRVGWRDFSGAWSAWTTTNSFIINSVLEMVAIPGGTFQMGSSSGEFNELPIHAVTLSTFYIGRYEVTQAQYQSVMDYNPSYFTGDANRPVEKVTWYDAVEFCNKLSVLEGRDTVYTIAARSPASGYPITSAAVTMDRTKKGYRLPTEAEWEYTARGGPNGLGYTYAGSNTANAVAWYSGNSSSATHTAGTKAVNELGLYDLSGNVWEWCWDWYGTYPSGTVTEPTGASSGTSRVLRGGSWYSTADSLRSAYRSYSTPGSRYYYDGFRVLLPQSGP